MRPLSARQFAMAFLVSATVLIYLPVLHAQEQAATYQPPANAPELWFPVGETLIHRIYWGLIPVGKSVTTTEWIIRNGRLRLAIRMSTRTNKIFDKIRPVNDRIESIVDPVTFRSISFKRRMIRRGQICDEQTTFDYDTLRATWTSMCGATNTFDIQPDTRDIMTFMYLTRKEALPHESIKEYKVMADDGLFDLKISTFKTKKIKLKVFGKVSSLKVEPKFDFDGLLVDKGNFTLWISEDKRRLLTRAVINGRLADIKVVLCQVLGPGDDSWTKATRRHTGEPECKVGYED